MTAEDTEADEVEKAIAAEIEAREDTTRIISCHSCGSELMRIQEKGRNGVYKIYCTDCGEFRGSIDSRLNHD